MTSTYLKISEGTTAIFPLYRYLYYKQIKKKRGKNHVFHIYIDIHHFWYFLFLSGDLNAYVFYLWHLTPHIRIFEKLTKKDLSELGTRAKVLGWLRWMFHSSKIKPCQSSPPHTWYFPGRYRRYVCQIVSFCSPASECYILEPPYLSYKSSHFCSHSLSFRRSQCNWLQSHLDLPSQDYILVT